MDRIQENAYLFLIKVHNRIRYFDDRRKDLGIYVHYSAADCSCPLAKNITRDSENVNEKIREAILSVPTLPERLPNADSYKTLHNEETKLISTMSMEELRERIKKLSEIEYDTKTRLQADVMEYERRKDKLSKEERDELTRKDKAYKPKPETIDTSRKDKKTSFRDDAYKLLKDNGKDTGLKNIETVERFIKMGIAQDKILKLLI